MRLTRVTESFTKPLSVKLSALEMSSSHAVGAHLQEGSYLHLRQKGPFASKALTLMPLYEYSHACY
jgi:hypothetical protein